MGKTELFCLALVAAWMSGVFFGLGLERRLFERKNRKIQTDKSNDSAPHPLPMQNVEGPGNPDKLGKPRLLVIARGNDDKGTAGVIFGRRDVLPSVPIGEALSDARPEHIETPNVEVRGAARGGMTGEEPLDRRPSRLAG